MLRIDRLKIFQHPITWIFEKSHVQDRPTRLQISVWILLLVGMLLISLPNYHLYQLGTHADDSVYTILAHSLLSSDRYGMINLPGQPAPGKYPFGYPLFLAPVIFFFPRQLDYLKIPSLIATAVNMAILFWGWRGFSRTKSYGWALAITGLYALSPITIDHTRRVMSEPLFITFCLLSILLAERAIHGKVTRWWSLFISLSLLLTIYIRTIGAVLVACVFLYLLWKKGLKFWKEIALILLQIGLVLAFIVAVTPVQLKDLLPLEYLKDENARLLVAPFSNSSSEVPIPVEPASTSASIVEETIQHKISKTLDLARGIFIFGIKQHFGKDIRAYAFPLGGGEHEQQLGSRIGIPGLSLIIGYLVSAVTLYGFFRFWRKEGLTLLVLFTFVFFTALFLWVWNDPRLLYPIQVSIFIGFLSGLEGIFAAIPRSSRDITKTAKLLALAPYAAVCILLLISIYKSLTIEDSRLHAGDLQLRTAWLIDHSAATDALMSEAPETDYVYSGRKAVQYPEEVPTISQLEYYLAAYRIRYIVVAPKIVWQTSYQPAYSDRTAAMLPMFDALCANHQLQLVYRSDRNLIRIYQVIS